MPHLPQLWLYAAALESECPDCFAPAFEPCRRLPRAEESRLVHMGRMRKGLGGKTPNQGRRERRGKALAAIRARERA